MTPKKPRTKDVDKSFYPIFMKRAQECLHAAKYSYKHQEWTSVAISAIHSAIAACDAICVYFLGQKATGESHNEAIILFKAIDNSKEISTNANRLAQIIRTKNIAEYEKRLIFKSEAEKILSACEKFFEFAKNKLP